MSVIFYPGEMFQSLTGSIHTEVVEEWVSVKEGFQSLTGSIHTFFNFFGRKFSPKFQSLTGSIHTKKITAAEIDEFAFQSLTGSIHTEQTFAPNSQKNFCFNPSQVQFTRTNTSIRIQNFKPFQSLTGSIHTTIPPILFFLKITVSIPHRFNSHRN